MSGLPEAPGSVWPGQTLSPYVHWELTRPDRPAPPQGVFLPISGLVAPVKGTKEQGTPGRVTRALAAFLTERKLGVVRDLIPDFAQSIAQPPDPLGNMLPEHSVFIGVVDDAIGFANERFRHADGRTRVDYLWVQGAASPRGVAYGREYRGDAVQALIAGSKSEEASYRAAGLIDMRQPEVQRAATRQTHGTAVADLAGGFKPSERPAALLPLAFVTLPPRVVQDTSGTFAASFVIHGILRILDHVDQRRIHDRRPYPVVINLSFGLTAGSKDGRSSIEAFLDKAVEAWGTENGSLTFVIPAGNHRQSRTRARLEPLPKETPVVWHLLPDDRTASFIEMWGNERILPATPTFSVRVRPPGLPEQAFKPQATPSWHDVRDSSDRLLMRAWFRWHAIESADGRGRESVTLAVPPTAPDDRGTRPVPAGDWQLWVVPTDEDVQSWPIDLSIQRDDALPGYRSRGRQSRFSDPAYRIRDAAGRLLLDDPVRGGVVRRSGSMNSYAFGNQAVVVGGVYASTGLTAEYSGAQYDDGERPNRGTIKAWRVSERSHVRHGVPASGTLTGSRTRLRGTSAAAPQEARCRALALLPEKERGGEAG